MSRTLTIEEITERRELAAEQFMRALTRSARNWQESMAHAVLDCVKGIDWTACFEWLEASEYTVYSPGTYGVRDVEAKTHLGGLETLKLEGAGDDEIEEVVQYINERILKVISIEGADLWVEVEFDSDQVWLFASIELDA